MADPVLLFDMTEAEVERERRAAWDVLTFFAVVAVLIVMGTSILLPFLPIGE